MPGYVTVYCRSEVYKSLRLHVMHIYFELRGVVEKPCRIFFFLKTAYLTICLQRPAKKKKKKMVLDLPHVEKGMKMT